MAEPGWHAVVTHMTEHIHTTVPVGAYVAQQTPGYGIDLLSTQKNTHILTANTSKQEHCYIPKEDFFLGHPVEGVTLKKAGYVLCCRYPNDMGYVPLQ